MVKMTKMNMQGYGKNGLITDFVGQVLRYFDYDKFVTSNDIKLQLNVYNGHVLSQIHFIDFEPKLHIFLHTQP